MPETRTFSKLAFSEVANLEKRVSVHMHIFHENGKYMQEQPLSCPSS